MTNRKAPQAVSPDQSAEQNTPLKYIKCKIYYLISIVLFVFVVFCCCWAGERGAVWLFFLGVEGAAFWIFLMGVVVVRRESGGRFGVFFWTGRRGSMVFIG